MRTVNYKMGIEIRYDYKYYIVVEIQHEFSTAMKFEVIFLGVPILLPTTTLPFFDLK